MRPEQGKTSSLIAIRNYLQRECNMLQVWAGKTADDEDYLTFVDEQLEHYAVVQSPATSREYTIVVAGDIMFMHEKNLHILADVASRIK